MRPKDGFASESASCNTRKLLLTVQENRQLPWTSHEAWQSFWFCLPGVTDRARPGTAAGLLGKREDQQECRSGRRQGHRAGLLRPAGAAVRKLRPVARKEAQEGKRRPLLPLTLLPDRIYRVHTCPCDVLEV